MSTFINRLKARWRLLTSHNQEMYDPTEPCIIALSKEDFAKFSEPDAKIYSPWGGRVNIVEENDDYGSISITTKTRDT